MHNILELERQWRHYRIKKAIPYLLVSLLLLISIITFLLLPDSSASKQNVVLINKSLHNPSLPTEALEPKREVVVESVAKSADIEEHKNVFIETPSITEIKKKSESTQTVNKHLMKPSLGFMKRMEKDQSRESKNNVEQTSSVLKHKQKVPSFKNEEPPHKKSTQKNLKKLLRSVENSSAPIKENINTFKTQPSSDKVISIVRQRDNKDLRDVINRFEKNKSPALSLFIAKRFYALGDYQQAYNYALITNEINSNIEDSWIIFAKSLVKLGQKDMAISTLNSYISHSHSLNAKLLLRDIAKGSFK